MASPAIDSALVLVRMLPSGADRCAVVRTGVVPSAIRPLARRISRADGLAWRQDDAWDLYAYAEQQSEWGRASVWLMRLAGPDLDLEQAFEGFAPTDATARVDGTPIGRVLRVEQRRWQTLTSQAERVCNRLVREFPRALEVSAMGSGSAEIGIGPVRAEGVTLAREGGFRLLRRVFAESETTLESTRAMLASTTDTYAESVEIREIEGGLEADAEGRWEDVARAMADERAQGEARDQDALRP